MIRVTSIHPAALPERVMNQVLGYDLALCGDGFTQAEQTELRALANVFDLEPEGVSVAELWTKLRPLVLADAAG